MISHVTEALEQEGPEGTKVCLEFTIPDILEQEESEEA